MAKESVVQIRIDSDVKKDVEELYRKMGTSFSEAVRVFAMQSIKERGFPFVPRAYQNKKTKSVKGALSSYASEELRNKEKESFMKAMVEKHG